VAGCLAEAFEKAFALDGTGRLLDVGCGPGTIALAFAHLFDEIVGLDPDEGVLAAAARRTAGQGMTNVRWVQARGEDLPAGLGTFRIVVFARGHRCRGCSPRSSAMRRFGSGRSGSQMRSEFQKCSGRPSNAGSAGSSGRIIIG
jgi:SAM-dependent methyltransferase